jgi:branched-chain amino acid transport system permease protein
VPAWIEELSRNLSGLAFLQSDMPAIQQLIFGLTIILFLIFEPRGLARIWERVKDYCRLWPFRY